MFLDFCLPFDACQFVLAACRRWKLIKLLRRSMLKNWKSLADKRKIRNDEDIPAPSHEEQPVKAKSNDVRIGPMTRARAKLLEQ